MRYTLPITYFTMKKEEERRRRSRWRCRWWCSRRKWNTWKTTTITTITTTTSTTTTSTTKSIEGQISESASLERTDHRENCVIFLNSEPLLSEERGDREIKRSRESGKRTTILSAAASDDDDDDDDDGFRNQEQRIYRLTQSNTSKDWKERERAISSALARDVESVLRVPDVIILNSMVLNFAFAEFRISAKEYRKWLKQTSGSFSSRFRDDALRA